MDSTDRMSFAFMPPVMILPQTNQFGQRIIEVVVWLPSGVDFDQFSVTVSDDMKEHLKVHVLMHEILANGWGLHSDLVPNAHKLTKEERNMNIRVHHYNSFITQVKNTAGLLPKFVSEIELPEEVCSKQEASSHCWQGIPQQSQSSCGRLAHRRFQAPCGGNQAHLRHDRFRHR
jgi:hypothetical protein